MIDILKLLSIVLNNITYKIMCIYNFQKREEIENANSNSTHKICHLFRVYYMQFYNLSNSPNCSISTFQFNSTKIIINKLQMKKWRFREVK